jgi:hypothetical protein
MRRTRGPARSAFRAGTPTNPNVQSWLESKDSGSAESGSPRQPATHSWCDARTPQPLEMRAYPRRLGEGGPRSRNSAEAIVTLDLVEPDSASRDGFPAMCFCVDCGNDTAEKSQRLERVLSHVSATPGLPCRQLAGRSLSRAEDGGAPGLIPWCVEVAAGGGSPTTVAPRPAAAVTAVVPKPSEVGKGLAAAAIDELSAGLDELASDLWAHPEVGYEEEFAHERIASFLEEQGVSVQRRYLGIKTAFRAEVGGAGGGAGAGPTVAIMAEYDALPGIGHACGHNLIAEAGVAAFLGLKAALDQAAAEGGGAGVGRVVLFGTPAEEQQGGKIELLNRRAFDGEHSSASARRGAEAPVLCASCMGAPHSHTLTRVLHGHVCHRGLMHRAEYAAAAHDASGVDVAMMVHPSPGMMLYPGMLAREMLQVSAAAAAAAAAQPRRRPRRAGVN